MVGFWNLGLKMIPNDRPRSSLGPPVDFGQKNPNVLLNNPIFARNKISKIMGNHDCSKDFDTNGWGPHGRTTAMQKHALRETALQENCKADKLQMFGKGGSALSLKLAPRLGDTRFVIF